MPVRDASKYVPIQEVKTLLDQSGLSLLNFARLMGTPYGTLRAKLNGHNKPTLLDLNAARFVMLRLGHAVQADPVPADIRAKPARYHRNQLGRVASRKRSARAAAGIDGIHHGERK